MTSERDALRRGVGGSIVRIEKGAVGMPSIRRRT
jgi:hypothetical protein